MPRREQNPDDAKVTGADVIAFIETVCFVPEGKFVGQKLQLQESQKTEICLIYDNSHGTRRAIISMGARTQKQPLPPACYSRISVVRPRATNPTVSCSRRRRAAIKRRSSSRSRPRWCA